MSIERPVIIVTGASRGLGAATALAAASLGAAVVLVARTQPDLDTLAMRISAHDSAALPLPADLSEPESCHSVIQQTLQHFGRIDALVNNAGTVEPMAPIGSAEIAAWEESWRLNLLAPLMLSRHALPFLRERHGRVINITSGTTALPVGGWGAYSTAKTALNQLTRVLAREEDSITAIAFNPGIMDTAMQATIRQTGSGRMAVENYQLLVRLYEEGKLLSPVASGQAVACLSLQAPNEWSGELLRWDDARVSGLVQRAFPRQLIRDHLL